MYEVLDKGSHGNGYDLLYWLFIDTFLSLLLNFYYATNYSSRTILFQGVSIWIESYHWCGGWLILYFHVSQFNIIQSWVEFLKSETERSFSSLRRVKTYLRNTMNAWKLNNLLLMHVHQNKTDSLNLNQIA